MRVSSSGVRHVRRRVGLSRTLQEATMNRWMLSILVAAIVGWMPASASAQDTKMARGTVTAVADDSLTVKVRNHDMTFMVDRSTEAIASGGAHRTAAAQKGGAAGPKLSDMIKVGQPVEVSYHDMNGMMHAASVRAVEPTTSATPSSA